MNNQISLSILPQYEQTDADKQRKSTIDDAWKAYQGLLPAPLKRFPGQPDDNVLSNRCRPIVDRGVDFLFGKEIEISVESDAPEGSQDALDDVWGRKETKIPLLQKLAMSGAIAGQAFLRIVCDDDQEIRLVVVDPSIVSVRTSPQDCETVEIYCLEYSAFEKEQGKTNQIFYREEIARFDPKQDTSNGLGSNDDTWIISHWSRRGDRGNWIASGDPIQWAYPFPPIFTCQNLPNPHDFWGFPDLTPDLIGVNNALNLVQSSTNRILKIYGNPILYSNGMGNSVADVQPGRIIDLPSIDSKITAVSVTSDVSNALLFAANLRSDIDEQSAVPSVATGRITDLPRGTLSGTALELLFMPLLKKTEKKQCLYGEVLIDVSKAILILNGIVGDIDISLAWQSPIPHDDLASAQYALLLQQLGISNTTIQRNLGFDPDEEAELSQSEDAQSLTNFSRGQGMPPAVATYAEAPNVNDQSTTENNQ